jgi:uncharacterized protein YggE
MSGHRPLAAVLAVLGVLVLVGAVLAFAGGAERSTAAAAPAVDGPESGVLVSGVGTVTGTPDVLRFTVGVEVTDETVDAALDAANASANRVIEALKQSEVDEKDLQTASVDIHPRHDEKGRQITGYVVRQDVTVKVRDLDGAGETITSAVAAGGDAARLSGVSFSLEDNEALLAAAREQAYGEARAKAEQYAGLADRELGEVLTVRETVDRGQPVPYPARAALEAAGPVPIEPGSTEVAVTVDVRWSLR